MNDPIVARSDLQRTYRAALATGLDHDDAVAHAADIHFVDPVRVESSVQAIEAANTQAMECVG